MDSSLVKFFKDNIDNALNKKNTEKMEVVDEIISILLTNPEAYNLKDNRYPNKPSLIDEDKLISRLSDENRNKLRRKLPENGIELYKTLMEIVGVDSYLKFLGDSLYDFPDDELNYIKSQLVSKNISDKEFEDYLFIDINTTDIKLREILRKIDEYKDLTPEDLVYIEKNQRLFGSPNFGSVKIRRKTSKNRLVDSIGMYKIPKKKIKRTSKKKI